MENKLSEDEIKSVYKKLNITPKKVGKNNIDKFEVWEIPPNKKGLKLFSIVE